MLPNKSPEPTAVGAFPPSLPSSLRYDAASCYRATSSSAIAVHVASRRWLLSSLLASYAEAGSFLR
jgi:hypothetical protein